jgi:hypothetical protein
MFRTVPLSIIRSFSLYTQQWYTSYRSVDSVWGGSRCSILILLERCLQTNMTSTTALCTVKNSWWWTEELSETCRVSFQNKFEKLVHLVGVIIRIRHDARSHERNILWSVIMWSLIDHSFSFKVQRQNCNNALLFLLLPVLTFVFTVRTSGHNYMQPKSLQILFKQYSAKVY